MWSSIAETGSYLPCFMSLSSTILDAAQRCSPVILPECTEPWAFEDLIDFLDAEPCCLGNHEKYVDKPNEAPARKEQESAPVIRVFQKARDGVFNRIDEQPVESLTNGASKRPDSIWPQFAAENVR